MKTVSDKVNALEKEIKTVEEGLDALLIWVPNIPHESVPVGLEREFQYRSTALGRAARVHFQAPGSLGRRHRPGHPRL